MYTRVKHSQNECLVESIEMLSSCVCRCVSDARCANSPTTDPSSPFLVYSMGIGGGCYVLDFTQASSSAAQGRPMKVFLLVIALRGKDIPARPWDQPNRVAFSIFFPSLVLKSLSRCCPTTSIAHRKWWCLWRIIKKKFKALLFYFPHRKLPIEFELGCFCLYYK
jgi:hypothetical protein